MAWPQWPVEAQRPIGSQGSVGPQVGTTGWEGGEVTSSEGSMRPERTVGPERSVGPERT